MANTNEAQPKKDIQIYLDIMSSTRSKGEWEWALTELLKLKEEE